MMHVGTRILTVEDDERIRTAVRLALEDEGWEVEETASGEEALAAEFGAAREARSLARRTSIAATSTDFKSPANTTP